MASAMPCCSGDPATFARPGSTQQVAAHVQVTLRVLTHVAKVQAPCPDATFQRQDQSAVVLQL
eukprot:5115986-Amphidinium_carterae.1